MGNGLGAGGGLPPVPPVTTLPPPLPAEGETRRRRSYVRIRLIASAASLAVSGLKDAPASMRGGAWTPPMMHPGGHIIIDMV